jgi:DNA polymerase (family X)
MVEKLEICLILKEIQTLLELQGENPFKIRAYENALHSLENCPLCIAELIETNELSNLKGIGESLEKKIIELAQTGHLEYYEKLKKSIPEGLFELLRIQGLGPKKINTLYKELNINSIKKLEQACKENKLIALKGFGEKTQEKILKSISFLDSQKGQYLLSTAMQSAENILNYLKQSKDIIKIELAGSLRRYKETIKDIDILVSSNNPEKITNYFVSYPEIKSITNQGHTKTSILLKSGINVDLRVVTDKEFPYALLYFTGSKEHNIDLRTLAKNKNIKLNEYGLWQNEKIIPCNTEKDIFKSLGLHYIPPELRENQNEIEFASKQEIPTLIEEKDLQGTLHIHTTWSDGQNSPEEMITKAKNMGYSYVGICDHSESAFYARGLSPERIKQQRKELDTINKKIDINILYGIEIEIHKDGSIDYSDDVLSSFDFVIAGVHSSFNLEQKEMTKRIITTLKNKYVTMLAHPTGRLLLERDAYQIDMNTVIQACSDYGKIIELNANPRRLDIDWRYIKTAKEKNVLISINTDAHRVEGLNYMKYGVGIARKGWLTAKDVINTLSFEEFCKKI